MFSIHSRTQRFLISAFSGLVILSSIPLAQVLADDVPPNPESTEDEIGDALSATTLPTPFFFLVVRWGNVIGEPETKEPVDMSGSVALSGGRLELTRTLLFEPIEDAVSEVSDLNVAWTSKI